jgi:hypothetical protein
LLRCSATKKEKEEEGLLLLLQKEEEEGLLLLLQKRRRRGVMAAVAVASFVELRSVAPQRGATTAAVAAVPSALATML